MRIKTLVILSFLVLFSACKKSQEGSTVDQIEQNKSQEITEQDVAKLKYIEYALDSKTKGIIQDWVEYSQIKEVVGDIKKGDLTFMVDRMDYFQNHVNQLTGQVNHWNDSLNLALDDLYELFKNLEVLQNEFEIDLLRLHSQGREQKKRITYVQDDLVNQRVDIAFNRQNMGGIDDTVSTLHKQFDKARRDYIRSFGVDSDDTVDPSSLLKKTIPKELERFYYFLSEIRHGTKMCR